MTQLTEAIAEFVTKSSLREVHPNVERVAKNAIIDCIGVTVPGTREDAGLIIQKYVKEVGGFPAASIIATNTRTTAPLAALANGVAAHVLDLDDTNMVLIGHPSVVLMPTVLAAGELAGASGETILLGYILGFEVMVKLAGVLNPEHYEHGWHATSTFGALGAAAAASRILGLSKEQTQRALGLATSLAGGVRRNFGTMTKSFHAGNAARAGLESALLCQSGFTAHAEILDQTMGFMDIFGKASAEQRASIADSLGNPYELVSSGIDIKRYPCCGAMQAAIDAAIAIREATDLSVEEIESIHCGENALGPEILVYPFPQTPLEAKFSIEYGVCRALLDGRLGLEEFSEVKIKDPAIQEMLRKTRSFVHPELKEVRQSEKDRSQQFPAIITAKLKDGTEITEKVYYAKGRWENPLTEEEIFEKYRIYAGTHLSQKQVESSLNILGRLEEMSNISQLMTQLTG